MDSGIYGNNLKRLSPIPVPYISEAEEDAVELIDIVNEENKDVLGRHGIFLAGHGFFFPSTLIATCILHGMLLFSFFFDLLRLCVVDGAEGEVVALDLIIAGVDRGREAAGFLSNMRVSSLH